MPDAPPMTDSAKKTRIMYIQQGRGLEGPGRIGRVSFSKSGRTIYYQGRSFISLGGMGYKTNYLDQETREEYWISGPRKDGQDTLYPGTVEIDDDAREEYWCEIRRDAGQSHETRFRSIGRHGKHSTR
jgi:hypothetical protein